MRRLVFGISVAVLLLTSLAPDTAEAGLLRRLFGRGVMDRAPETRVESGYRRYSYEPGMVAAPVRVYGRDLGTRGEPWRYPKGDPRRGGY